MNPLFLPKGSIRAILIIIFTGFIFYAMLHGVEIEHRVIDFWFLLIGFYFGLRSEFSSSKNNVDSVY